MIHKTAIIDSKAKVSSMVEVGPYSVIGPDVEIDDDVIIQSHVTITGVTKIGKKNIFFLTGRDGKIFFFSIKFNIFFLLNDTFKDK